MKNTLLMTVTILSISSMLSGCFGEGPSDKHIAEVVEKTLNDKPEIIMNALENFRKQEEAKVAEKQKEALSSFKEDLAADKHSLVLGNPKGDVTVVAFKDYRCGYCKKVWPDVTQLINDDIDVRVIVKEYPVLGPQSEIAARFALASSLQGQELYEKFNDALFKHSGPWDSDTLKEIASKLGIDTAKMEKEAGEKFVSDALASNMKLGASLSISGTPAFVVGEEIIPGAVPLSVLKEIVKKTREKNKS